MSGTEFVKNRIWKDTDVAREAEIFNAITGGNSPSFMKTFVTIELKKGIHFQPMETDLGDVKAINCQVTTDYLSVGDNTDYVRMPMRPATAQRIADKLDCLLPTKNLVDLIEGQPSCKIAKNIGVNITMVPSAFKAKHPDKEGQHLVDLFKGTSEAYLMHNKMINDGELSGVLPGRLVSGHKKDIVIPAIKGKVVIYDWPAAGKRSVHGTHGSFYVDYSHGVRLVKNSVTFLFGDAKSDRDAWGDVMTFVDALKHPILHKAFADAPVFVSKYDTEK